MIKYSLFTFIGEIYPKERIPPTQVKYDLDHAKNRISVQFNDSLINISFFDEYEYFEDVYTETVNFMQAILSVQTLYTGIPVQLVITEWKEIPISPLQGNEINHPVNGRIYHTQPDQTQIPINNFITGIGQGLRWAQDIDENQFLKRAILDFSIALQLPLSDAPIYLYRAIESAETYFGGEKLLCDTLHVSKEVKFVKKLANDSKGGIHSRHAAKTIETRQITPQEIYQAVTDTRKILLNFQTELMTKRYIQE